MGIIRRLLNSFVVWGGWIIIPIIMEVIPVIFSILVLKKRRKKMGEGLNIIKNYHPDISIIVPVYNSQETLGACIKSIYDSTYPNENIRVFLVNNKGSDNSFEVFAESQEIYKTLKMQWLNAEQGKSRALNMALYNCEGKYIINIDSDGILEKHALENLIAKFEANPNLNCMTGAVLINPELINPYKGFGKFLRNLEFMEYAQAFLAGRVADAERNAIYTLSGAFSAFRKSSILTSRMYNTDTICEDTQLTFQMRYINKEHIDICETALFYVDPIEDMNKLYTQRQRWQRGSLEVGKMFADQGMNLRNSFRNINVKTLLYDHTFAFPRFIWYIAILFLFYMNYSGSVLIWSTMFIMVIYIVIGWIYSKTAYFFLQVDKNTQKYYKKHKWYLLILPFFNFLIFFIRFAGIINSIDTDSSWKTNNLTQEFESVKNVIKKDIKRLNLFNKIKDK